MIEASLNPLVTIERDGRIMDVNTAAIAMTGRPRERLVGTDFSEYFTDPARARAGYEQAFRDGFVHDYPLEIRHTAGSTTPVIYNAAVYRNDIGEVADVFAAARDISGQARAEREMRHLASFPQRTPVPIIEFDRDLRIQFLNPAMHRSRDDCKIPGPRVFIPADWAAKLSDIIAADEAGTRDIEIVGRNFDERLFLSQELQSLPIWATDSTDRKQVERSMERLNRTLRTLRVCPGSF